jgi:hypothetical protein
MTDQELARDRAIRELARLLKPVTNLKNPEAAAIQFVDWLYANHFRYVAPPPGWKADPPNPEATARGVDMARDLLNIRKDDHA